jgi:hypothetical protein
MYTELSNQDLQKLIALLWKRSSSPIAQPRIGARAVLQIALPTPLEYLILETMSDPESESSGARVFSPTWANRTHSVELISETMPIWIIAIRAQNELLYSSPREAARRMSTKKELMPDPDAILRYHLAVVEKTP